MIEHEAAAHRGAGAGRRRGVEPSAARSEVRRRLLRARADRRLDSESPHRLSARLLFALSLSRSSRGRIGRRFRTARRERVFIGPVTPNGVLSGKRRRGRRWGSRAEPSRSEKSRRVRGADVARVARSPPAAAVGRASVRAICAAAGSCAGTPSTMIAARKLIERRCHGVGSLLAL